MFARASLARILALVVAVLFLWALFAGEGGANGPEQHYRVRAGDTLWSIAEKTYFGRSAPGCLGAARAKPARDGDDRAGPNARAAVLTIAA